MLETGTILAGYRIDAALGSGGMGAVYVATQLSLNRTVALKVLAAHLSEDPTFRARFRQEGLVQAALDHPHIVPIYEAGEADNALFLAMRLIRGRNLKERIVAGELDAERTLRILTPLAGALDAAHAAGLIHRDIKPQNVIVGSDDHAYLADFGLGRAEGAAGLTKTGELVGTLDYVAPEQVLGKPASGRSDVYAFGAVLYECLTGVVPYPRDSDGAILYAHVSEPAPVASAERPELPASVNAVIARAMAKKPGQRHASAGELMQSAEAALLEAGPLSPAPASAGRESAAATEMHEVPPWAPDRAAEPGAETDDASGGERACPSCGRSSDTDGRFCPYCGSEYKVDNALFEGFGRDDFTCLADPSRRPERIAKVQVRVRALWAAVTDALPAGDADEFGTIEVEDPAAGEDLLRSYAERGEDRVGLVLTLTPRELVVAVDGRREAQSRALLAWLVGGERLEELEDLDGYRLVVWMPQRKGAAGIESRRIFDRDATMLEEPAREELIGLMSGMERITGMSSLWRRPPFQLRMSLDAHEAAGTGEGLAALVASELARLLPLMREMDRAFERVTAGAAPVAA